MKPHGKIPTDFNTGRVLQCLYLWVQENKKQHIKIPNCSLMKAGLFSFNNKKHLCDFPSHTEKQIFFFFPFHAWIWFKFWPNFGEGPPRICLVVEREETQRYSWREAASTVQIYPQSDPRIQLRQSLNFSVGRLVFMIVLQCVCGECAYHSAWF